jgi:hypothetical protein
MSRPARPDAKCVNVVPFVLCWARCARLSCNAGEEDPASASSVLERALKGVLGLDSKHVDERKSRDVAVNRRTGDAAARLKAQLSADSQAGQLQATDGDPAAVDSKLADGRRQGSLQQQSTSQAQPEQVHCAP